MTGEDVGLARTAHCLTCAHYAPGRPWCPRHCNAGVPTGVLPHGVYQHRRGFPSWREVLGALKEGRP